MAVYGLDYQQVPLHAVGWAPTTQQADGEWLTTWNIRLREPLDAAVESTAVESTLANLAHSASRPDFRVELSRAKAVAERDLTAHVVTSGHGQDAAYWDPTYALLRSIDAQLGRIWTIESKPRLWYPVFQFAQQALLKQLSAPQTAKLLANSLERLAPLFRAASPAKQRRDEASLFESAVRLVSRGQDAGVPASETERAFAALSALPDLRPHEADDAMREIRREVVTAALAALRAVSTGAPTMAALALRKAFDGAYLFDEYAAVPEQDGVAFREDDLWLRDVRDMLADQSPSADEAIHERTLQVAAANAALIESALGLS